MQVCTSLQADNHASTPPLSFLQAGCPSCRPTNSINALKAVLMLTVDDEIIIITIIIHTHAAALRPPYLWYLEPPVKNRRIR